MIDNNDCPFFGWHVTSASRERTRFTMTPNGINGINIRDLGMSRENIMAFVRDLNPAYVLVHDSPALAAMCASLGIQVIYRASGDDPALNPLKQDPAAFVQARADAAPQAAYLHLTNEIDPPNTDLHRWTRQAMQYATRIGRKVVIYNFGTNKSRDCWEESRQNIVYAGQTGHAVGVHVYRDGAHDDGAFEWLSLKREIGGTWILTECAYIASIFDAYCGWRGKMSPDSYAALIRRWVPYLTAEGVPILWFSYDTWPADQAGKAKGFGFWDAPPVLNELIKLNRTYTIEQEQEALTTFPKPETLGTPYEAVVTWVKNLYVNLRAAPTTSASDIGDIKFGDKVVVRPTTWSNNGYKWARLENPAGWVASDLLTFTPSDDVDAPRVKLDVPYVSQLGVDANAINNDCPEATVLMLIQYNLKRHGLPPMNGLKVNMLVAGGDLKPRVDNVRDADHLIMLLREYCADGERLANVTPEQMVTRLDQKRPVIALMTYDVIKPNDTFKGNHWLVLTGYGRNGFYGLDSYKANGEVYIPTTNMMLGMKKAYSSPLAVALV